jgi:dienelactone hydrolase
LPDHRRCEEALTRVGEEPAGTAQPVELGPSRRHLVAAVVLGLGFDCIEEWLEPIGSVAEHVRRYGYDQVLVKVDALSSTENNARQIRDAVLAMPPESGPARLVLIGYSKGAPDILDALVTFPEIRDRVAAVVSAAGAVGGSPLANDAAEYHANLLRHFPGAVCNAADGTAVASLRPAARRAWLAANPLPADVRYYSLVTFPEPQRISAVLKSSYRKLARVDSRNDGQLIFYDQVIPGSHLLAYVNADHWSLAVPIARSHSTVGALFVTQNAYPREALLEALLRFVEEDLSNDKWTR